MWPLLPALGVAVRLALDCKLISQGFWWHSAFVFIKRFDRQEVIFIMSQGKKKKKDVGLSCERSILHLGMSCLRSLQLGSPVCRLLSARYFVYLEHVAFISLLKMRLGYLVRWLLYLFLKIALPLHRFFLPQPVSWALGTVSALVGILAESRA